MYAKKLCINVLLKRKYVSVCIYVCICMAQYALVCSCMYVYVCMYVETNHRHTYKETIIYISNITYILTNTQGQVLTK